MTFDEFKDWFLTFDTTLGGGPPSQAQWWELKARLDAVDRIAAPRDAPSERPAVSTEVAPRSSPAPQADDIADAEQSELTVYEEAITLLKRGRR